MVRFCPNCGTEVDESAVFCPTCGQAIDQEAEIDMPGRPRLAGAGRRRRQRRAGVAGTPSRGRRPTRRSTQDQPASRRLRAAGRPAPDDRPHRRGPVGRPAFTMPVMLSGWLIGGGSLLGALGARHGLFSGSVNLVELLLLLGLGGIAATVFLSASFPTIPNLRLATMAIVLVGFGVALDRLSLGAAGIGELLLLLGTAAAAMGAIILEIGRDQPMGPAR